MITTEKAPVIKNGGLNQIQEGINQMDKSVFILVNRNTVANRMCVTAGQVYEMPESEARRLVHAGKGTIVVPEPETQKAIDSAQEEITPLEGNFEIDEVSGDVIELEPQPDIDEPKPNKKADKKSKKR